MDSQDNLDYRANLYVSTTNLHDHLLWQLNLMPLSDSDLRIAEAIIEATNHDGFLSAGLENIQQGLDMAYELDEIEAVRHLIQHLDPLGCASTNLKDCLLAQLPFHSEQDQLTRVAKNIIHDDIEVLAQHNYRLLKKRYDITDVQLEQILHLIQQLHPKPGNQIQEDTTEYIIPDVSIKKINQQWQVFLNQHSLPKISINQQYAQLATNACSHEDSQFIKSNLQEAKWFLKSIQSRQDTLLRVASCIMEHQSAFLEHGETAMKPLILQDIASALDLHESTVSRVTTQKFINTPKGVYELKYFFSSHLTTDSGTECSSTAIKAMIKRVISEESTEKPLSDLKISKIMAQKGIHVARRTVAKYRESMGIFSSSARKSIRF
jgi:RNA polymerase sigma-54 factor